MFIVFLVNIGISMLCSFLSGNVHPDLADMSCHVSFKNLPPNLSASKLKEVLEHGVGTVDRVKIKGFLDLANEDSNDKAVRALLWQMRRSG